MQLERVEDTCGRSEAVISSAGTLWREAFLSERRSSPGGGVPGAAPADAGHGDRRAAPLQPEARAAHARAAQPRAAGPPPARAGARGARALRDGGLPRGGAGPRRGGRISEALGRRGFSGTSQHYARLEIRSLGSSEAPFTTSDTRSSPPHHPRHHRKVKSGTSADTTNVSKPF